jgi:hypothetical protein
MLTRIKPARCDAGCCCDAIRDRSRQRQRRSGMRMEECMQVTGGRCVRGSVDGRATTEALAPTADRPSTTVTDSTEWMEDDREMRCDSLLMGPLCIASIVCACRHGIVIAHAPLPLLVAVVCASHCSQLHPPPRRSTIRHGVARLLTIQGGMRGHARIAEFGTHVSERGIRRTRRCSSGQTDRAPCAHVGAS